MDDPENHDVHIPVKTKLFVYISHCFTTMGARMWWFGIGLFLVEVTPHSLQLTALYGFSNGGAMLLLAAVIGDWIDKSNRLKAARVALILNNISISICCVVIFFVLKYRPVIEAAWEDSRLLTLCFAIVVIITIFANLTNLGRVLIMERDWIVEICQRDKATIATMSATFRFIDLCTKVVAPLVTGQIMTYGSHLYGAIFIAGWNIVAVFAEYYLIWKIYTLVPALHSKSSADKHEFKDESKMIISTHHADKEYHNLPSRDVSTKEPVANTTPSVEIYDIAPAGDTTPNVEKQELAQVSDANEAGFTLNTKSGVEKQDLTSGDNTNEGGPKLDNLPRIEIHDLTSDGNTNEGNSSPKTDQNITQTVHSELSTTTNDPQGTEINSTSYQAQERSISPNPEKNNFESTDNKVNFGVYGKDSSNDIIPHSDQQLTTKDVEAGEKAVSDKIGMSSQPQEEEEKRSSLSAQLCHSLISLYRGWKTYMKYDVSIAGWSLAFLYFTVLGFDNITIGYATTQGMSESLVGILIGCAAVFGILASISFPILRRKCGLVRAGTIGLSWEVGCLCLCIVSLWMPGGTFDPNKELTNQDQIIQGNCTKSAEIIPGTLVSSVVLAEPHVNMTLESLAEPEFDMTSLCNYTTDVKDTLPKSKASIIMLLMGIVGARFGVWLTDLAITQLFLEAVTETERGIVNGFQSSLNKLMDMLKFIMIIFIPDPSMFGYPAVVSFCFIFSSWLLYTRFSKKRTGNLLYGKNSYTLNTK
ncbi:solute carrier family 40 member 1-like [Ylistrum balloti]|uniref:solute carrier family 40 member 1-like n=1 Tax=Ylistrum balloti TaxID=509963 RepID=UPI002905E328|nr:solute carrier family 40 member 1-like [Ylistrum balloti]